MYLDNINLFPIFYCKWKEKEPKIDSWTSKKTKSEALFVRDTKTEQRAQGRKTQLWGEMRMAGKRVEDVVLLKKLYPEELEKTQQLSKLISNGKVFFWERKVQQPICFCVLNMFHHQLNAVEILHMFPKNMPQRDYKYGVILMRSIASQFLSPPDQSKRPYDFIFAKIPHDVREEREAFFRKSGYNYDSSICILSLKDSSKEKTVKFHIQTAVKVGSSVEGIFTAYAIESLHSKTTVLKRYRDFIRLRKKLQLFVGDAKVPKLPKKRLFGSTDIEELNKQKEKLETWLNGVAAIPQAIVLVEDFMKDDLLPKKKKKNYRRRKAA